MTIPRGTFLGPYEILDLVGSGGMGQVYRARDKRLGRNIAIKVLSPTGATGRERLVRFEREARLASSLNHPNIVTVYDIGEQGSVPYIAMELVEGKTVREMLTSGPLPLRQIMSISVQIADALAKAHESGIVHRDLKPENVMVTPDGVVKILDFGLGKNAQPKISFADSTIVAVPDPTNPGTILGTVDYMSPEQASAKDVDFRSDQFSFGSIIYEMVGGQRAFRRETAVQTMSAIIGEAPVPLSGNPMPAPLRKIVDRCLEKKTHLRYASTRALVAELRELYAILEVSESGLSKALTTSIRFGSETTPRFKRTAAIVAAVVVLAVAIIPSTRNSILERLHITAPLPASKNLVVLPFHSADNNADNQQFAAGLTETITTALTQLTVDPSLQMSPASEVTTRHIDTPEEARRVLAANLVLTGTVTRNGDTLSVKWAVEDAVSQRALRSRTITVNASERLRLEYRTIEAIVDALEMNLTPAVRDALQVNDTPVPGAKEAYLRGRGYLQEYDKQENVAHAIALFEEAQKLDSNYAQAYAGLGEAYWRKYTQTKSSEWIDAALKNCQTSLEKKPQLAAGHACLGFVYASTGRYREAIDEYDKALRIEPVNDDFRRQRARAEERDGKLQEAEATYREAIRLRPHYWANYNSLGAFYINRAKYNEAIDAFSQVVKLAPDSAFGYTNLGAAYNQLGRYTEAIAMFQQSATIRPTPLAYSNLATAYFSKRQFIEAAETFEKARTLDENNYAVWGNLADAYYWAAGKRDQAGDAYRKAIELALNELKVNSRDATILSRLANYYIMLDDRESSLSYLKRALEIAPNDPAVRFRAALVHNQLKEDNQTLDWLEKAAEAGYSITTIRDIRNFDHLWAYERFQNLLRKY
jgi:serine/threonine protein kinase/tetratricopeptide (TPR) repeat protein